MSMQIFDKKLLDVLICPVTREQLIYDEKNNELIAIKARLAYPIRNGIPIMLENEARKLSKNEK
ncbi:MAG: Trm112 family protein [Hyphomicrobiales bacterium]